MDSNNIGLALSGGGIRGAMHIGFLEATEKFRPQISAVAGTSIGSIIGAFYAAGYTSQQMLNLFKQQSLFSIVGWSGFTNQVGLMEMSGLQKILEKYLPKDFSELEKPFTAIATELESEKVLVIDNGNLHEAVIASCSIPILFKPVQIQGKECVDGGVLMNLPANVLINQTDKIIGVDINKMYYPENYHSLRVFAEKIFMMSIRGNTEISKQYCDYIIEPNMPHVGALDFKGMELYYQAGLNVGKEFRDSPEKFLNPNKVKF
ncbi:patatin-like phospholipase family protein [Sediminitomix flava]|uniref:NTE family protein n=1 Tax=Sediminitomix flava TaxID=379075 RepID=A0A315ZEI1_SEDFL|nr:patatin-like phospholipase family protein [Sediminitomix flava]PWJ44016.1 NTE family protein [Sediminitomix flava]